MNMPFLQHTHVRGSGRFIRLFLYIPTPCPSPSKFDIVPIVTGTLMGRMGVGTILPITVDTVINF